MTPRTHAILRTLAGSEFPPPVRVIPFEVPMDGGGSKFLPFESALGIVDKTRCLAVTPCACRLRARKCDGRLEVCLQLDRAAEYTIRRGSGGEVTRQEAGEILRESAEAGLVHTTENRADNGHVICNCCSCCCGVLSGIIEEGPSVILAPSRFLPAPDADACILCQTCVEVCPVDALSPDDSGAESKVTVEESLCIGCGQCAYQCPEKAIVLREVRSPHFVPGATA